MLDIKFVRENPDAVKENIKKKFQDAKLPLVDEVIELDKQARALQQEADELRAKKNAIAVNGNGTYTAAKPGVITFTNNTGYRLNDIVAAVVVPSLHL